MSIEKKSLISTLKSAKKANIAKDEVSFDHSRNAVKAQPVVKAASKAQPVVKAAAKAQPVVKAARKLAPRAIY
jgi:hypothetical protein